MTLAPATPTLSTVGAQLAALSQWVDHHPANTARDPEAQLWGRVAKVGEEAGEAFAALIALTGQNPRKPATGTFADVRNELLDVAVTALAAVEHIDGNNGGSMEALAGHLEYITKRAGIA